MQDTDFTTGRIPPFIELQSVDSTNNYARGLIDAKMAQHGMAVFAYQQVAGKGQRGKSWISEKDENIALSIIIKPFPILLSEQFQLSACMALASYNFLKKYTGEDTRIKWPNDLYWQDRKAGGILIESVVSSSEKDAKWDWAIIGIGININQTRFPENLPNPVSVKQITGKSFEPVALAKELYEYIEFEFSRLIKNGFSEILNEYNRYLYKKDKPVKLKKSNRTFESVIKSVTPKGKLLVHHSIEEEFDFGEVEWIVE